MWFPRVAPQFYERPAPMSIPPKTDVTGIDGLKKPVIPSEVEGSRLDSASSDSKLPNSRKIYVAGEIHPDIRVPFREILLAPTKTMSGEIEVNEPVLVYDTSGPWGDADQHLDVNEGLPALRAKWIRDSDDVEEVEGRAVRPQDNGYLSEKHAAAAAQKRPTSNVQRSTSNGSNSNHSSFAIRHSSLAKRRPLRAKPGRAVTQLWYAREGIVTPEMEFIAIRENARIVAAVSDRRNGGDRRSESAATIETARNALCH